MVVPIKKRLKTYNYAPLIPKILNSVHFKQIQKHFLTPPWSSVNRGNSIMTVICSDDEYGMVVMLALAVSVTDAIAIVLVVDVVDVNLSEIMMKFQ